VLVVDEEGRPQGWAAVRAGGGPAGGGGPGGAGLDDGGVVGGGRLERGGTVARIDGSLRGLLDAALSSPSGRGVVADADGRLLGTVRASEVLATIEAEAARARADTLADTLAEPSVRIPRGRRTPSEDSPS
jgi:osmoprotectant transport system ATP-binding protein